MNTHADRLAHELRCACDALDSLGDSEKLAEPYRAILAVHASRTFANDCHEMADRCADILRNDDEQRRTGQHDRLRDADRTAISRLRAYAHGVGDEAECAPETFKESQR